jgi:hypothetical protein
LNIAIVSLGFRERAKAKSKTARGCHHRSQAAMLVQHPAILPWPSDLPTLGRALARPGIGSFAAGTMAAA